MMKPTRLAALYLTLVFLAGALFGFVASSVYNQRTARASNKDSRERYIAKLQSRLSLTPEQVTQITALTDQTRQNFRELRERMDPEFQAIRQEHRARVKALLTPDQLPKYEKILEEYRQAHEKDAQSGSGKPH